MGQDIYFTKAYAEVNALIEAGEAIFIELDNQYGHITHSAIKREIANEIDGVKYYDLITPYGYGGPIIHRCIDEARLIESYEVALHEYCEANRIVSEFVRFHPLFQNQEAFKDIYDVKYLRQTVGTDLRRFDNTFQSEFSTTARRRIRNLIKEEKYSCVLAKGFDDIEDFISIYKETMDRRHATDFYYFNRNYFYELKRRFRSQLVTTTVYYQGEIIAMGLYFLSGKVVHDHLNGTKAEYLHLSPAYLLKYTMMNWASKNGFDVIHYGGGVSNAQDDSVLKFKKSFAKNTDFEFHIGSRIWNQSVYEVLCRNRDIDSTSGFFPAYRAPVEKIKER
ncbi:GNAT family N-acetyltransferase [Salinicoccus sesuvii]|uniref:Lipid II:glycine glycyltransferase n=1 Tax=Salinicoccus sesuvii TaxID=868281 RepID=A0ABV7N928_9STAP